MSLAILYPNGQVEAVQVFIWDGSKPVLWDGSITVSTSGGPIQDGVNAAIKATVLSLTDSKPLTTAIVDANGDQITSFGGGTQYTEDAPHTVPPIGTALLGVRKDTLAAITSTDGDNIVARLTNKGEQYVKHVDVVSVDGSGVTQPVSAASLPQPISPTTIFNGKTTVTTSGTRVVLASSTTVKSVTIKALVGNTGVIYVGNSTVSSSNGFVLSPGDTISMDIANLNTVNIDSAVNGEGVTYVAVN